MLKVMRKHAKYFYVLFFMIIISFIGWGVGTVDKTGQTEYVAEVGKYKITAEEYWRTYDMKFNEYRDRYKENFDEEMQKKLKLDILYSLINRRVLLAALEEKGITISDEELNDAIKQDSTFMRNGAFDYSLYQRLDKRTKRAYENSLRQDLKIIKMLRLIELSIDITDIGSNVPQTSGNEQLVKTISEAMAKDMKEKAVKSYLEGLKKQIKIKVNTQMIS